jgi:hypothetical protein
MVSRMYFKRDVGSLTWISDILLESEARLSSELTRTGAVWRGNNVEPLTAGVLDSI